MSDFTVDETCRGLLAARVLDDRATAIAIITDVVLSPSAVMTGVITTLSSMAAHGIFRAADCVGVSPADYLQQYYAANPVPVEVELP